jgi:hypothetical protein
VTRAVDITPAVVGRYVFYNNSIYDGSRPLPDAADDNAIAADKVALRPGGPPPTAANLTNFRRGLNGIMVDLGGRAPGAFYPSASDFAFRVARGTGPATRQTLTVIPTLWFRPGAGVNNTDRVEIILPESAARDAWLEVTVRAGERTGLKSPDVFYFGNLVGDTGDTRTPAVNATDVTRTRRAIGKTTAAALSACDFNRDGKIDAADVLIARNNQGHALPLFTAPAAPAATAGAVPVSTRAPTRPPRRGLLDPAEPGLLA